MTWQVMEVSMNARLWIAPFFSLLCAGAPAQSLGSHRWAPAGFPGSGGPGGDFDWVIGSPTGGPPDHFILDTTYAVIVNAQQTRTETVIDGQVDVRNLTIHSNGILELQGPNPCVIAATGAVHIRGVILAKGRNNLSVATLNTTNISEPGAPGTAGGGRGGTGNPRTSMSSAAGAPGYGAFGVPGLGGGGGESAYNPNWPNGDDTQRRPAGGGGGAFGHDFLRPIGIVLNYANANLCPDQAVVGCDAESGFPGYPGAVGVVTGMSPPRGGSVGPRPFTDNDRTNDFWGTMSNASGQMITGELQHPWAGAGGGGGGNAIVSNSFPTTPFDPAGDEKGAGGGGGGGSLTILSLGPIVFGQAGRIDVSGGTGGGGENSQSGDITHIGGGSGGGSGGHVILESSTRIDFSRCRTNSNPPGGIYALGGNGGAGKNNVGGAQPGGFPAAPTTDALPTDVSYPSSTAPCGVNGASNSHNPGYPSGFVNNMDPDGAALVVICAGGDGGPGIVQLHVPDPSDIIPPAAPGETIYKMIKPPPVASLPPSGAAYYRRINSPALWNRMPPTFGVNNPASSSWTRILGTTGAGANAAIELASILAGESPVVSVGPTAVTLDGAAVADDLYLRDPALLRGARLVIALGGETLESRITAAEYTPETRELRLEVAEGGSHRALLDANAALELRPRIPPDPMEFQTAPDGPDGGPDLSRASAWSKDLPGNARHVRYRIRPAPREDDASQNLDTPVPALDSLRVHLGF